MFSPGSGVCWAVNIFYSDHRNMTIQELFSFSFSFSLVDLQQPAQLHRSHPRQHNSSLHLWTNLRCGRQNQAAIHCCKSPLSSSWRYWTFPHHFKLAPVLVSTTFWETYLCLYQLNAPLCSPAGLYLCVSAVCLQVVYGGFIRKRLLETLRLKQTGNVPQNQNWLELQTWCKWFIRNLSPDRLLSSAEELFE